MANSFNEHPLCMKSPLIFSRSYLGFLGISVTANSKAQRRRDVIDFYSAVTETGNFEKILQTHTIIPAPRPRGAPAAGMCKFPRKKRILTLPACFGPAQFWESFRETGQLGTNGTGSGPPAKRNRPAAGGGSVSLSPIRPSSSARPSSAPPLSRPAQLGPARPSSPASNPPASQSPCPAELKRRGTYRGNILDV